MQSFRATKHKKHPAMSITASLPSFIHNSEEQLLLLIINATWCEAQPRPCAVLWVIVQVVIIPTDCRSQKIIWVCTGFTPTTQRLCLSSCGWTSCLNGVSLLLEIGGSEEASQSKQAFGFNAAFLCPFSIFPLNLNGKGHVWAGNLLVLVYG